MSGLVSGHSITNRIPVRIGIRSLYEDVWAGIGFPHLFSAPVGQSYYSISTGPWSAAASRVSRTFLDDRVRTGCIIAELFSYGMEVEAVGLKGEVQVGEVANVSGGRWEVATKYIGDFEDFFFVCFFKI